MAQPKQFAAYSSVLGKREDLPNILLDKVFTPDSKNCQFWNGKVRTIYGRAPEIMDASGVATATPDNQPVLKYLLHQSDSSSKHLLAFTSLHAYRYNTISSSWDTMFTCSTAQTVLNWSVKSFNGRVVATNNVDVPLRWTGNTEDNFANLDAAVSSGVTITRARCVAAFEGHILFGDYDLSDGNTYPSGLISSDLDDETEWQNGDASAFYVEGEGTVRGIGIKADLLYVFKTRSSRAFWYTATDLIYSSRPYLINVGTFAPDSIVNDGDGNLYFFSSDHCFREIDTGIISVALKDSTRNINHETNVVTGIQAVYIAEYNEVWWACPVNGSSTNNIVFCYIKPGIWYERNIAVSAFGLYERSTNYTWDNQPEGTWDDWTGIWDDATESADWTRDICGDYYGYTYSSHYAFGDTAWDGSQMAASSLTYYFVLTIDMANKQALRVYKRLLYLYGYFTSIGGEDVSIYVKQDNEAGWQSAGSMSTSSTAAIHIGELSVDYRARHFLIKIQSSGPFEFLGMEFEYLDSGGR